MKFLRGLKNRFYGYIYDSSINVKDRTFVLFSIMYFAAVIIALLIGLFLKEPVISTLVSIGVISVSVILLLLIVKYNKFKVAKIVVAFVMVFAFQPAMFFTKGGLTAGAPFSLLLGTYYLVLILEGRFRVIMCIVDAFVLTGCWLAAYYNPALVSGYSVKADYTY